MEATRGTILVVDDEPAIVELLSDYLADQGFDIVRAHGGREALAQLQAHTPDVILLDVRMPGMDGIEVLKRVRALNTRAGVLMVSGNDDLAVAKETLALGAFDYILKPVDFVNLSGVIDRMLAVQAAVAEQSVGAAPGTARSGHGPLYDLALEIFVVTRALSPAARGSVGALLEQAALNAAQRSAGGEKPELRRALDQIRILLHLAMDLGDITDEAHRSLQSQLTRARRSTGLS